MSAMKALFVLATASLATALPIGGQQQPGAPETVVLRAGDGVRVTVWQREDLSGDFGVDASGRLLHPVLRDAVVAGLPFEHAIARIGDILHAFHGEVRFVAEPLIRIGVAGEVRQPNLYHLPADMTVAYAVAHAGGPTDRGRLDRVILMRGGSTVTVDLTDPAGQFANTPLRSGDQILVGRRRDILREYVMPLSSIVGAVAALIRVSR
jgi:protein involved in polysaccharide export with SLBB domain